MQPKTLYTLTGTTVCYVSTEAYGGVWRTVKQARTLAEAGAQVVVAGFSGMIPEPLRREPFEVLEVQPLDWRVAERHPALFASAVFGYVRNRLAGTARRRERVPASQRIRHQALVDAVVSRGADVVDAVDLVSLDCAAAAACALGARLVYASHELWPEFVDNPDVGISHEVAESLLAAEREFIGEADLVITVSEPMSDRLVDLYGIRRPLSLLNAPPQKVDSPRGVSSPVRFVFHGGLSQDRNLDGLIRAMVALRGSATLDIHGYSRTSDVADLQRLIESLDLQDTVRLCGAFEYEQLIELLSTYDVGVWTAKMSDVFSIALANKLFDSICAGLAVATGCSPAVREVLESTGCGICVDPSSPETIAQDLLKLVADPDQIAAMKRAAVDAAPRYWWPEQGEKLVAAFEDMLGLDPRDA